jgi:hypothetical protein
MSGADDDAWADYGRTLGVPVNDPALVKQIERRWEQAQYDLEHHRHLARMTEIRRFHYPSTVAKTMTQRVDMWRTIFRGYLGPATPAPDVAATVQRILAELDAKLAEWAPPPEPKK